MSIGCLVCVHKFRIKLKFPSINKILSMKLKVDVFYLKYVYFYIKKTLSIMDICVCVESVMDNCVCVESVMENCPPER